MKKKEIKATLAIKKQFLSIMDRKKRLKWCKGNIDHWKNGATYSDEANFEVWRKNYTNSNFDLILGKTQGGGGSVGIWGCINTSGTGMTSIYDGRLNAARYIDVLHENLQPSVDLFSIGSDFIYQQDNAP